MSEADKSRELVIREVSNIKELENDRHKEMEQKKDAEIKMHEKIIAGLRADKKELEERIEDIIMRQEVINSKHAETHHNTVKYFEGVIAQQKIAISKYQIP